jgi:AcrR family transcriptional regulator
MVNDNPAQDRILLGALDLFLRQGVKKTNLNEVAHQAGVTRVTVYRYYHDKEGLVRAVCLRIAAVFQEAARGNPGELMGQVDGRLNRLAVDLTALPQGNLLAWFDEIRRLYPSVYEDFRATRQEALDRLFLQALEAAQREGMLREGLHQDVLKAIFWAAVIGLIESPSLITSSVSMGELVSTVSEVFRHGILK